MKVSDFKVNISRNGDGTFEIDLIRNKKSMFCMDAVLNEETVTDYVKKLEQYLEAPYISRFRMSLNPGFGEQVLLNLDTLNFREGADGIPEGIYTNLTVSYPTDKNGCILYNDRKVMAKKIEVVSAFYKSLIQHFPQLKSELVESILENGDLESFYERIA